MAFQPVEMHVVLAVKRHELQPEILILFLLESGGEPFVEPFFFDCLHDVGRIAPYLHVGVLPPDGLEPLDYRKKFHAVVRGAREASGQFLAKGPADKHCAPSAGPRIAAGRAVGVKVYGVFAFHFQQK